MRRLLLVLALGCPGSQPLVPAPVVKQAPVDPGEPTGLPKGYVEVRADRVVQDGRAGRAAYVAKSVLEEAGYKWDEVQRQLQQAAGSST